MINFAIVVFFLLITPGPGVLSQAGVAAAYGPRPALSYLIGLGIGTNIVGLGVATGLAAIVVSLPIVKTVLFIASICYLLYLALVIGFSGRKIAFIESPKAPGIRDGIILQAVNPKAYVVYTALFSGFAFWPSSQAVEIGIKFAILNAIWLPIHIIWLSAGIGLRRLALSDQIQSRINIAMALAMLMAVAVAAFSF